MKRSIALGVAELASAEACAQTPMSYLHTFGPAADPITRLAWGLMAVSVAVSVIIAALVLGGILRRRPRLTQENVSALAVDRDGGGLSWIYIGIGISTVVLIACMVWTFEVLAAVGRPATTPALTIEINAQQWWWSVRYRNDDPAQTFITANEIHIPVGQPVRFELQSADVIHSFWIPQLAGKTDVIPGQRNIAWLQADTPGRYRGQCAEYCGAQHAHMALQVVADPPEEFETWRRGQVAGAAMPLAGAVAQGDEVFAARCAACHTVRGTPAGGLVGPDLTHLKSRETIAAGLLQNDPADLENWIARAQSLKPGTQMPDIPLAAGDMHAVIAYLDTLR